MKKTNTFSNRSKLKLYSIVTVVIIIIMSAVIITNSFAGSDTNNKIISLNDPNIVVEGSAQVGSSGLIYGNQSNSNVTQSYKRFFSPQASWNIPVSSYGEATSLKEYAGRLWDYGGGIGTSSPAGNFFPQFKNGSVPIYDIKTATTTAKVFQTVWAQNQLAFSNTLTIGSSIPWNPAWRPGGYGETNAQNDRMMSIVNFETGETYELWRVEESKASCFDFLGPNGQASYDVNNNLHLCIAGISRYDNLFTAKEGSTIEGRGMGINKLALITRADEVASGKIEHALELTIANPMFGPDVVGITDAGAGTTKGFFMKPATRLEHSNPSTLALGGVTTSGTDSATRAKTVPSGMRFAIKITNEEIEQWLITRANQAKAKGDNSWAYNGPKSNTARIFAVAWRDYGAIVGETGGWGIGMETDGIDGPAKETWSKLGIVEDAQGSMNPQTDLFTGLLTRDRLYVVNAPA